MNFSVLVILASVAIALGLGQTAPPASRAQNSTVEAVRVLERPSVSRVSRPKSFSVPAGNNFVLKIGGSPTRASSFYKLTSGQVLEETHCVQINCPPGMDPGTVCWRCYEILAPDAE